jgi:hypothetical protein
VTGYWGAYSPAQLLAFAALAVILASPGALFGGLQKGVRAGRFRPNQRVHTTLQTSSAIAVLAFIVAAIAIVAVMWAVNLAAGSPMLAAAVSGHNFHETVIRAGGVAILFWLAFGGLEVVKHYSLRLLLSAERTLPRRIAPVLDYACQVILLRRVGAGYVFMHRLLLEHLARPRAQKSSV